MSPAILPPGGANVCDHGPRDEAEARLRAALKLYVLLHKPKGYLTAYRDPQGRKTVYDRDTSGLIIMTNDSAFAEALTNPAHEVPKIYLVKASRLLTDEELARLRRGVTLKDGPTRPARVTRLRNTSGRTVFELTITQGRNRQVRRMVAALGAKALKLVRVAIGAVRPLVAEEVRRLTAVALLPGNRQRQDDDRLPILIGMRGACRLRAVCDRRVIRR